MQPRAAHHTSCHLPAPLRHSAQLPTLSLPLLTLCTLQARSTALQPEDRAVLWRDFVPWAVRAGLRCPDLMCLHYEHHLAEDLQELRGRWRVLTAPHPPAHLVPRLQGRQQVAGSGVGDETGGAGPAAGAAGAAAGQA